MTAMPVTTPPFGMKNSAITDERMYRCFADVFPVPDNSLYFGGFVPQNVFKSSFNGSAEACW
jgi:hypothetical protein